jgi:hypothetical protein
MKAKAWLLEEDPRQRVEVQVKAILDRSPRREYSATTVRSTGT